MFLALVCCALSLSASADTVYELVTSETVAAKPLAAGDKIIFVAKDANYAMSTTQNANNRGSVAITKNADNTIKLPETNSVQVITLETVVEGENTYYYFYTGTAGYLCASSSSSNNMKTSTAKNDNSKARVSIEADNTASVAFQGTYTRKVIRYNPNNGTPLFSCYAGSGSVQAFCIYREKPVDPEAVPTPSSNITSEEMKCKNPFSVTLTLAETAAEGDKMYYSIEYEDGTAIAKTEYTEPFTIEKNGMLTYWAERGDKKSDEVDVYFEFSVAELSLTPATGRVSAYPEVEITSATTDAQIYYTLDGSDPTTESTLYTGKFTPTGASPLTIKAKGFRGDWTATDIVSATYTIVETQTFTKVMSDSELSAGDKIIIVYETDNVAMAGQNSGNYRERKSVDINDKTIEVADGSGVQVLTLEAADDQYRFNTGDGYLSYMQTGNNLTTVTTISTTADRTKAAITIFEGNADILFYLIAADKDKGSSIYLQYNAGSPRFSCYKNTQKKVQVYKLDAPKECVELSEAKALADGAKFCLDAELLVLKKHDDRLYVYDKNEGSYAVVVLPENELVAGSIVTDKWNGTVTVVDGQKRLVPDAMLTASGEESEFDVNTYAKLIGIDNAADLEDADAAPVRLENVSVANTWTENASATFTIFLASKTEPDPELDPVDGKEIKIVRRAGTTFKGVTTRNVFGLPLNAAAPEEGMGLLYDEILVFANATDSGIEVYPSAFSGAPQGTTGIETITADDTVGETYFVDLTGRRVAQPTTGVYLKVSGTKVEKVAVK